MTDVALFKTERADFGANAQKLDRIENRQRWDAYVLVQVALNCLIELLTLEHNRSVIPINQLLIRIFCLPGHHRECKIIHEVTLPVFQASN